MSGVMLIGAAGLALLLVLPRLFVGPTLYDRLMAFCSLVMKVTLLLAAAAVMSGGADVLTAAFVTLLSGVVAAIAALKFIVARSFQPALVREET